MRCSLLELVASTFKIVPNNESVSESVLCQCSFQVLGKVAEDDFSFIDFDTVVQPDEGRKTDLSHYSYAAKIDDVADDALLREASTQKLLNIHGSFFVGHGISHKMENTNLSLPFSSNNF